MALASTEAHILLHIDQGEAFLRVDETFSRCDYRGPYVQEGKFGRISGYLRTFSPGNNQYGRFGAARY